MLQKALKLKNGLNLLQSFYKMPTFKIFQLSKYDLNVLNPDLPNGFQR